jgi:hypothetical protein
VRSADTTGATIERPVSSHVNGGFCRTDGKGTAGGVFPSSDDTRLAFSIGPGTYSPMLNPKSSKKPYKGPATYKSVMMSLTPGLARNQTGSGNSAQSSSTATARPAHSKLTAVCLPAHGAAGSLWSKLPRSRTTAFDSKRDCGTSRQLKRI